jgi:PAS domain S-box-containing protein
MEIKELVFDVIDNLSYPVILFEETAQKEWLQRYLNQKMENLLKYTPDDSEKSSANKIYEDSLHKLVDNYNKEEHQDSYTLHDVEIFGGIYNINFNHNKNQLLIIFVQIPQKELFDNITFHDLSGSCNSIIIVLNSSGEVIDMNECFLKLVEMEKESVLGKSFFETFMPAYAEKLGPYMQEIVTKDTYSHHFVTPLKNSQGKQYRINWQVSKIVKNEQIYVIAVGSDITKFIEENSDLKRQLTSIRVGFDYFPLAIGYMNASGKFITTNPRFKKIFGIKKTDEKIMFNDITILYNHTSFEKIKEYIELIKEMSYYINYDDEKVKQQKLKIDIRLLNAKKKSSSIYIVVAQKII